MIDLEIMRCVIYAFHGPFRLQIATEIPAVTGKSRCDVVIYEGKHFVEHLWCTKPTKAEGEDYFLRPSPWRRKGAVKSYTLAGYAIAAINTSWACTVVRTSPVEICERHLCAPFLKKEPFGRGAVLYSSSKGPKRFARSQLRRGRGKNVTDHVVHEGTCGNGLLLFKFHSNRPTRISCGDRGRDVRLNPRILHHRTDQDIVPPR